MPPKKGQFGGGNPRERQLASARKRVENRKIREAEEQGKATSKYADLDLAKLGHVVLREIVESKATPPSVRAQASKYLLDAPDDDEEATWRNSVQVRPDYEPPTWPEVIGFARSIGACK